MQRRDFLGSTLGFFTTTSIPWIARLSVYKKSIPQPRFILPFYKTALRLDNGLIIQGPGIKKIDKKEGFIYTDIDIKTELVVKNCILIYKNQIVSEKQFSIPVLTNEHTTLKIVHYCQINYNGEIITPFHCNWTKVLEKYLKKKETNLERHNSTILI